MSAQPWRGTLIYVGTVAAITAAGVAKFAGGATQAVAAPLTDGTTQEAPSTSDDDASAGSADGSASDPTSTDGNASSSDDVTVVGSVAQTRYGNVQVSVTFSGDKIIDVQTLQAPDRERRDAEITRQAIPILTQEAVAAQSAQIDTVSGATYTSQGYVESLQAAIDQRG